jgi:hypothetical protein
MLQRLAAARFAVRHALAVADRDGFTAFRWARLWVLLQRSGATEVTARRWVASERAYQRRLWTSPPVPAWAAVLLPPEPEPAPHVTASPSDGEAQNLRRLLVALDASRFERTPLSVRARDWAAGRPGLGERWADGALVRLGDLGVLTKVPGIRRLPTWHLPARDEALRRLDDAFKKRGD